MADNSPRWLVLVNELAKNNPNGRRRIVIHCDEKAFADSRDRVSTALPAAVNRMTFETQALTSKAQASPTPYAEVYGSGITSPASAK